MVEEFFNRDIAIAFTSSLSVLTLLCMITNKF